MEPDQPIHDIGLDPRTLLALALLAAAMVMTTAALPALAALLVPLIVLTRLLETFGRFWRWLRWVLPMVLFFGLVTAWALTIEAGLLAGIKLLGLIMVGHLFFLTTPPEEMANAMVKAGLPYEAAFVVSAGMQFVSVLGRKAREVLDAQQARGIPIVGGWRAIRHFPAFFTPMLIQSFQLAEELAEAMEARGFGRKGRSFYAQYHMGRRDWLIMAAGLIAVGVWVWYQYR